MMILESGLLFWATCTLYGLRHAGLHYTRYVGA